MDLLGKRVLVTGGHGFLGRHVVEALIPVVRTSGEWSVHYPSHELCDWTNDVDRDEDYERSCTSVFHDIRPEVLIHLAANCGGIGKNQEKPADLFMDNAQMGINVIGLCAHNNCRLVLIGTCCSYPKLATVPFKESSLWNGYPEETNAPYGIAKRMLITMAQAYRQQYGLNAITLIPANLYGPGDNFDLETSHVIPAIIRKAVEARNEGRRALTLWGTGTATREFLHVKDAARAIVMATERYDKPEPVNIGTGKEISIYALAKLICSKVGFTGEIQFDTSKPDGQPRRCLDVSRAKREFGFEAEIELSNGLDETIAWYESQAVAV